MSRLKLLILTTVCVLTLVVVWFFLPASTPKTDEARFQRWQQTHRLWTRTLWWERHLPHSLGKLFQLSARETKFTGESETLEEALLGSGYFTNFPIAVAAPPTNGVQRELVAERLRKVFQHRDAWQFWERSNAIVITCRPQDVELCRQTLQE